MRSAFNNMVRFMKFSTIFVCATVMMGSQMAGAQPIVGGYSAMSISAADTISIAKAAVKLKNALPDSKKVKLLAITKAESQVVAGQNFKLCLSVKQNSRNMHVQTVVYRDLSGELILTEWTPKGC
jgi:Cystatin domain